MAISNAYSTSGTVRDAVIALLRSLGMTTVFGNPGSTELPFFKDWPEDFRYILGLQEASVVAMADAYAQATHNAAFVNLHSAAGLGHALGSVFTAYRNQTPLVLMAGQQTRAMLLTEPYLGATDATEFPRPYVKWSCEPALAQDVPTAIARAYYLAMQKPCGPTFVSVPADDWEALTEPVAPRQVSYEFATLSASAIRAPRGTSHGQPAIGGVLYAYPCTCYAPDAIIVEEAPTHENAMHDYLPIRKSNSFYTMSSGGLGYGLPAGVGLALANPERRVICLLGDGLTMYSIQGLWTAVQHHLSVTFIVLNNHGYGALKDFGRMFSIYNIPGVDLPGIDLGSIARGYGCAALSVAKAEELAEALTGSFAREGPVLIDVLVDPVTVPLY